MKIKLNKNIIITNDGPPLLIAEISANHCGSKKKFLQHIISAKKSGADLIKIQTYETCDMTISQKYKIKSGEWKNMNLAKLYDRAQTPYEWHYDAFKLAKKLNVVLFSTPFSIRALNFLKQFNPPIYKIASFEITDVNLINEIAKCKKPIILSTGLSNRKEIENAIKIIKKYHNKIILLHCISGYPTPDDEINLKTINFFKKNFKVNYFGISDHTKDIDASLLASTMGISIIEKHFILSKKLNSPDSSFSINPNQLRYLKNKITKYYKILGKNNFIRPPSEKPSKIFRRSIFAINNIKKGEKFTKKNISCFRPLIGIGSENYFSIIGKKSKVDLKKNNPLFKYHIK